MNHFAVLVLLTGIGSQVIAAGQDRGGGDICEDRIKIVREDLISWIHNGGPKGLDLPQGISVESYSQSMLEKMSAKIKCVGDGDIGYPINVNGTPKVCRFDSNSDGDTITCDFGKFNSTDEAGQYVLVHHEYAGLAHLEVPNGDDSKYNLSNQITAYLEDQVIKKLAIRPISRGAGAQLGDVAKDSDGKPLRLSEYGAEDYCLSIGKRLPTAYEVALEFEKQGSKIIDTAYPDLSIESKKVQLEIDRYSDRNVYETIYKLNAKNETVIDFYLAYLGALTSCNHTYDYILSSSVNPDNDREFYVGRRCGTFTIGARHTVNSSSIVRCTK